MADARGTAQDPAQNIQADPDVSTNASSRPATRLTDTCSSSLVNLILVLGMMCVCALTLSVYLQQRGS